MIPMQSGIFKFNNGEKSSKKTAIKTFNYEILLNGRVLGYVDSSEIEELILKLRYLKALASMPNGANQNEFANGLPKYMEICHVPKIDLNNNTYSLYPGLYLFTSPGRMMRPDIFTGRPRIWYPRLNMETNFFLNYLTGVLNA
jgi:hypothetical protein